MATNSYYSRNKERLKRQERERYHRNKPEIAKRRKLKRRAEKLTRRVATLPNGRQVTLFTVGEFAERIGKATSTIRGWEMRGIVPSPLIKTSKARRMYSQEEVDLYDAVLKDYDRNTEEFSARIWAGYEYLKGEFDL